jgi:hypothetical protein
MTADDRQTLLDALEKKRRLYRNAQKGWSFLYHSAVFATPVVAFLTTLSAATSFSTAISTTGAALITLLSTLAALGGFQTRWRNARESRSAVDRLILEAEAPNADLAKVRADFIDVIAKQDAAVLDAERKT